MSYDVNCICGHVEGSHRVVMGDCRRCDCHRFLNPTYVAWLFDLANGDHKRAQEASAELARRKRGVTNGGT